MRRAEWGAEGTHTIPAFTIIKRESGAEAWQDFCLAETLHRINPEFPMAHIHEKIDFTVAIFIVHNGKLLLIHHRALDKWLPLGGHIELDEDPEQAALREAREESGLEVELLGERPPTSGPGTRALIRPRFLDIHRISGSHEHVGIIYWARLRGGTERLSAAEHHDIRWCSREDLEKLNPPMDAAVKWYCTRAIDEISALPDRTDF
jgi:8-oxo-dGTP pyrophosphatase MutT (NUDIX family)